MLYSYFFPLYKILSKKKKDRKINVNSIDFLNLLSVYVYICIHIYTHFQIF